MIRRYLIVLDDGDVEPPVQVIADCLAREMLAPVSVEDVTPNNSLDVDAAGPYIGYAHIYLHAADEGGLPPLYAACPMTAANLPLLARWLTNNHAALCKESVSNDRRT